MSTVAKAVKAVSTAFDIPKDVADDIIQFVLDFQVTTAMENGRSVYREHKFRKVLRKERTGRNPQTGEKLMIPEKTVVIYTHRGEKQQVSQ